eukprot:TRINITY_DN3134_c0_g1_i1.p1 TRINITY_DN3134_c0_g1~~TRINITY_DN3134_c0_g1_i1.p1  ORF type:complete len:744 (+),score=74.29 TRINITY_DN3134_c0_g1_i1:264-2495(+)
MKSAPQKGLRNTLGQYNCFLNVVIQTLWNLPPFRDAFRRENEDETSGHHHDHSTDEESCVLCALKTLFLNYEFADASDLPPDTLRAALSKLFAEEQRFQIGQMDDACEAHEAILDALHMTSIQRNSSGTGTNDVEKDVRGSACMPSCLVHRVFGLNSCEQQTCTCTAGSSDPILHTSFVYYTTSTSLLASTVHEKCRVSRHLRAIRQEDTVPCVNPECDRKLVPSRYLFDLPDVFTIGVRWHSESASREEVAKVFDVVSGDLNMADLFDSQDRVLYRMCGVVCYYGRHYHCMFYNKATEMWMSYDDTKVTAIGPALGDIRVKCVQGRLQPSLVFYTQLENAEICHEDSDISDTDDHPSPVDAVGKSNDGEGRQLRRETPYIDDAASKIGTTGDIKLRPRSDYFTSEDLHVRRAKAESQRKQQRSPQGLALAVTSLARDGDGDGTLVSPRPSPVLQASRDRIPDHAIRRGIGHPDPDPPQSPSSQEQPPRSGDRHRHRSSPKNYQAAIPVSREPHSLDGQPHHHHHHHHQQQQQQQQQPSSVVDIPPGEMQREKHEELVIVDPYDPEPYPHRTSYHSAQPVAAEDRHQDILGSIARHFPVSVEPDYRPSGTPLDAHGLRRTDAYDVDIGDSLSPPKPRFWSEGRVSSRHAPQPTAHRQSSRSHVAVARPPSEPAAHVYDRTRYATGPRYLRDTEASLYRQARPVSSASSGRSHASRASSSRPASAQERYSFQARVSGHHHHHPR